MSDPEQTTFDLGTSPESKRLHEAMVEAFTALQTAHAEYERALAVARDVGNRNPDGILALRQRRIDYAAVANRYNNAVMTWLAHADKTRSEAVKLVRKKTMGE